jgi:transcriptional regulator with XRE-family HTH domain
MTGAELKERLSTTHISLSEIARRIGVSPQNLNSMFNSEDVKSGAIEKLAKALDVPITFFYRDSYIITGNNIVNSGSNNAVNASDDRLISLLVAKDEQLTMAMKQTSKAQSQMDELIAMWKNK